MYCFVCGCFNTQKNNKESRTSDMPQKLQFCSHLSIYCHAQHAAQQPFIIVLDIKSELDKQSGWLDAIGNE